MILAFQPKSYQSEERTMSMKHSAISLLVHVINYVILIVWFLAIVLPGSRSAACIDAFSICGR